MAMQPFNVDEKATASFKLCLGGLAQGTWYAGIEQHFIGSLRVQHTGTRFVATAKPADAF